MKRNNRKGFTIVELVIVIAVIAILAGVLIPTFGGMIKKANDSATIQEANAAYKTYTADINYVAGDTASKNLIIQVETDEFVIIKDGVLVNEVYDSETTAKNKFAGTTVTLGDEINVADSDCKIKEVTISNS